MNVEGKLAKCALGFLVLSFCAAPVPGDIGGCGQEAQELDPIAFFGTKQVFDCEHCRECNIASDACTRACAEELVQSAFPRDCVPLVHDGEVCLRALSDAGCDDYATYMRDAAPVTPTECNFCPVRGAE
jgi:hypothetical protein